MFRYIPRTDRLLLVLLVLGVVVGAWTQYDISGPIVGTAVTALLLAFAVAVVRVVFARARAARRVAESL